MPSKYSKVKKICNQHGLKCRKWLVSKTKYSIKCPYTMSPKYLTIHNTGNNASAHNEASYMRRNNDKVSFHWVVDNKEAILVVPMSRNAWHAGDGSGTGNRQTIGMEIAYETGPMSKFKAAEKNGAILASAILEAYGWSSNRLKRHYDWSGKKCPGRTMSLGWSRFKKMVKEVNYDYEDYEITKPFTGTMFELPSKGYLQNGDHGVRVKRLQEAMNWATGLDILTDGWFGDDTKNAVEVFQSNNNLTMDGVFGKKSYAKLKNLIENHEKN